jgi:hypothetical protein
LFPINLARNVGREGSTTFYVLVNDIELYPNPPDLIPKFLKLVQRLGEAEGQPQVFVLPPFEVKHKVKGHFNFSTRISSMHMHSIAIFV